VAVAALRDLRRLVSSLETPEIFKTFGRAIRREKNDRALILMCAGFVDTGLKVAIWMKLDNKDAAWKLFEDHGPLHQLNAKIRMGEAMGLYGAETRRNLEIIQTVRNAFAHSLHAISFSTSEVSQACQALTLPNEPTRYSGLPPRKSLPFNTPRERFVTVSIVTVEEITFGQAMKAGDYDPD
jgi:hypothetical protein